MRENFNLLTALGRANFSRRLRSRFAWECAALDTRSAVVCLVRGHQFSDTHAGVWCQRCFIATRPVSVPLRVRADE